MKTELAIKRELNKIKKRLFSKKKLTALEHEFLRTAQQSLCFVLEKNIMPPFKYYEKFHKFPKGFGGR